MHLTYYPWCSSALLWLRCFLHRFHLLLCGSWLCSLSLDNTSTTKGMLVTHTKNRYVSLSNFSASEDTNNDFSCSSFYLLNSHSEPDKMTLSFTTFTSGMEEYSGRLWSLRYWTKVRAICYTISVDFFPPCSSSQLLFPTHNPLLRMFLLCSLISTPSTICIYIWPLHFTTAVYARNFLYTSVDVNIYEIRILDSHFLALKS